ncbi:MAG TPA: response regulator [Pseudoneobacillus sp.]|nr:response regulator [Pseudoneobacillus sp.]
MKLLIIEENNQKCEKLVEYFDLYFSVNSANNGLQGLINAIEWRPDILLINHYSSFVNSLELCHQLRQKLKTTIIIIVGDNFTQEKTIEYFQVGADDVYEYPIIYPALLCKIKVLLKYCTIRNSGYEEVKIFSESVMN